MGANRSLFIKKAKIRELLTGGQGALNFRLRVLSFRLRVLNFRSWSLIFSAPGA